MTYTHVRRDEHDDDALALLRIWARDTATRRQWASV